MNTTISNKAELKAHIANKKLANQAGELTKQLVDQSNSVDHRVVSHMIAKAIGSQETFGVMLKGAADLYALSNKFVDARMQAGKAMLVAISKTDVTVKPSTAYTLSLPDISKYVDVESGEKVFELCSELLSFSSESPSNMALAQSALDNALRTTHPTICQQFLSSTRTAMMSIDDSVCYCALSNAYHDAMPYV